MWRKLLLVVGLFTLSLQAQTLSLKAGWNLVGPDSNLSLAQIQTQVGGDNLLVIQGPKKTFQKTYVDLGYPELNDFIGFERATGYWIKIAHDSNLTYEQRSYPFDSTIELKAGWNLVGPNGSLTLEEIKNQVGVNNLLIIQGPFKTYQKAYVDQGFAFLNDFEQFEEPNGYWIKVENNATLQFSLIEPAKDYQGNDFEATLTLDNNETVNVYIHADAVPTSEVSNASIAIFGVVDGTQTGAALKLTDAYAVGTHFQVIVKDANGTELGRSEAVTYQGDATPIDFGTITTQEEIIEEPTDTYVTDENHYMGLQIGADMLDYSDYRLAPIDDASFHALSESDQRKIALKMFSIFYQGVAKSTLDPMLSSGKFVTKFRALLDTPNSDLESVEEAISDENLDYNWYHKYEEQILARLYTMTLGREYVNHWAAYVLAQTIMFSPAYELDTVSVPNIAKVYNRLVRDFNSNHTHQFTTFMHMISDENWRRFRSPEDNGREMLELFLLDFNDANVPLAGQALQGWYLDPNDNTLVVSLDENREDIELFGTTIKNGYDFYRELVKAQDFVPTISKRLVGIYFPNHSNSDKGLIASKLVSSGAQSYVDLLKQIVLSKEFLFHSDKVKSFEETFFGIGKQLEWKPARNSYQTIRDRLIRMRQSSMGYKLGRKNITPFDTLSFASFHKIVRENLFIDSSDNSFNEWDAGWSLNMIDRNIHGDSFDSLIDHLFLSTIGRLATTQEYALLQDYILDEKNWEMDTNNNRQRAGRLILDYISRLNEVYRFGTIEEASNE
jgi:hypothetical protein